MNGIDYPCEQIFCHERAYHISCNAKKIIDLAENEKSSAEVDIIKNYNIIYNNRDDMVMVWKIKYIAPIILIRQRGDLLTATYNFTFLSEVTCVIIIMLFCSFFVSRWELRTAIPKLILYMLLIFSWIKAVRIARCVDKYFKKHEIAYDDICSKLQ